MPNFAYECTSCGLNFERRGSYSDITPFCGSCGGQSRQLVTAPFLVFKGHGFYVNDYGSKEKGESNGSK